MPSSERKLSQISVAAALALLMVSNGCTGFFVNQPNSIAVTQSGATTLSVAVGSPQQLTATATFNSGTKIVTNQASWSSSSSCATVGSTGIVTAVGPSSNVTITATLAGVQGTIAGSTTGGSAQTLTINPPSGTFTAGAQQAFTAALNGVDVTNSTTWTSSNTSVLTFSGNTATFVTAGSATIAASFAATGTCATGSESITVQ